MSHSILTAPTGPLGSTLIWNLTAWFSTCVTRMAVGSPTCVPMRQASTRSSASVIGITMWTARPHQTGTIWMTWPTERTPPKQRSMTSENRYLCTPRRTNSDKADIELNCLWGGQANNISSGKQNKGGRASLGQTSLVWKTVSVFWWLKVFLIHLLIWPSYV